MGRQNLSMQGGYGKTRRYIWPRLSPLCALRIKKINSISLIFIALHLSQTPPLMHAKVALLFIVLTENTGQWLALDVI